MLNDISKQDILIYDGSCHISYDFFTKNIKTKKNINNNELSEIINKIDKNKSYTQIVIGSLYDPYPKIEKEKELTRNTLKYLISKKLGVTIITSSRLLLRDIDLLNEINKYSKVKIFVKIPSLNEYDLKNFVYETKEDILNLLENLSKTEFDISIYNAPVLPYINDDIDTLFNIVNLISKYKIDRLLSFRTGVILKDEDKDGFYLLLDEKYSGLRRKYESMRETDYVIKSPKEEMVLKYLNNLCKEYNIIYDIEKNLEYMYSYTKKYIQMSLF